MQQAVVLDTHVLVVAYLQNSNTVYVVATVQYIPYCALTHAYVTLLDNTGSLTRAWKHGDAHGAQRGTGEFTLQAPLRAEHLAPQRSLTGTSLRRGSCRASFSLSHCPL